MTSRAPERARLFVALELPADLREALIDWRRRWRSIGEHPALRPVPAESLHVTLCFLGMQSLGEVGDLAAACLAVAGSGAVPLALSTALWLPRRSPSVLAVGLDDRDSALERVQSVLSAALERGGWYRPEPRPFLPHVTIARVRRGGRVPRDPPEGVPPIPFDGTNVALYRSHLDGAGARYEALCRVGLRTPRGGMETAGG